MSKVDKDQPTKNGESMESSGTAALMEKVRASQRITKSEALECLDKEILSKSQYVTG